MDKNYKALIIILLHVSFIQAQNLVKNPSLETYITCPGFGQFSNSYIQDWDKPSWGSTDYYHFACPGILPSQQIPRTGNAYAGIIGYNYGQEYREYMTGILASPLIPGATYYCEFYVSLNDGYIQAINELGAYFSATPPGPYSNTLHIPLTPQVVNSTGLLDDTTHWMRVSGYFLASGGEEYITIGNFSNDSNTTIVQVGSVGSFGSYYFVDDVWVSVSEGLTVEEEETNQLIIWPNPASDKINIRSKGATPLQINISGLIGNQICIQLHSSQSEIDISSFPPGIYMIELITEDHTIRKKFTRQ